MSLASQNRVLVGWRKRIAKAEANDLGFWARLQMRSDAADWTVCAIGERSATEPRPEGYSKRVTPLFTKEAKDLGYEFTKAIKKKDFDKAKNIIRKIESLDTIYKPWNGWLDYFSQIFLNRTKSVDGKLIKI